MNSLLMYLKKYRGIVLCLLLSIQDCIAQLKVNDTCPDVSFSSVINIKESPMKFSDFKGKAMIIDFWDTHCHSCVESFPMIDSLQKKFKNDLQIILVTKQERKTIEDFFSRFKKIKVPDVPIVTDDTTLSSLFPSEGYPYIVWIDRDRIVKYFTNAYSMTSDHFDKFLKGIKLDVREVAKKTVYAPIWNLRDSVFLRNVKYFSSLTSCINGIDMHLPDNQMLNEGNYVQLSSNCSTPFTLIKKAFGESNKYPVNTRYGVEIFIDSSFLIRPSDPNQWDEWDKVHLFNYQLILPVSKKELLYKTVQEDLQRYFDISVVREKEMVKGYELINLDNKPIPVSKNKKPFDAYNNGNVESVDTLRFINQPLERLIFLLNSWIHNSYPFTSTVKEQKRIDFTIHKTSIEPFNIKALNQDLKKLNLELKEREIEIDVLIIRDKK